MPTPFDSLGEIRETLDPEIDEEVDGLFGCDHCPKQINVAHYTKNQTLYWTCPNGHTSERVKFPLG